MLTATPSTMPIDDVLRGVSARLECEFPELPPDLVTSAVKAAGRLAEELLPDLPAFVRSVASTVRRELTGHSRLVS